MVTSGFFCWKPAIQACCAASWALEPAPAISPESFEPPPEELADADESDALLSLPHAASATASTPQTARARTARGLVVFECMGRASIGTPVRLLRGCGRLVKAW